MNKITFISLLALLFNGVMQKQLFCQFNPTTNCFSSVSEALKTETTPIVITPSYKNMTGIPCDPNHFFAMNPTGNIDELSISGSTANFISVALTGAGHSIAYRNNLNGG